MRPDRTEPKPAAQRDTASRGVRRLAKGIVLALAAVPCLSLALAPAASASKATVFTFGSFGELGGQFSNVGSRIAVNQTGNGGVPTGTVYVNDTFNRRIQAFDADGNFLRAWGRDVDTGGGTGFEICTVAADCKAGADGSAGGEFTANGPAGISSPFGGVAVDQATGNVYVADKNNRRIQAFDADGNFLRAWGKDVDTGGGTGFELCTVAADCKAGSGGSGAGEFATFTGSPGIGVDSSANVYVADSGNNRIQKFDSGGAFLATAAWDVITDGSPSDPGGIQTFQVCAVAADCKSGTAGTGPGQFSDFGPSRLAVDPAGDVYAVDENHQRLYHFTSALDFDPGFAPAIVAGDGGPGEIAVNPADGDLFIAKGGGTTIYELDPATQDVVNTHFPGFTGVAGLDINSTSGRMYAVRGIGTCCPPSGAIVSVLEDVPPPIPTLDPVEPVTDITSNSATFHGSVNPNGIATGYHFEYRAEGSSTWTSVPTTDVDVGSGSTDVPVSQAASGLAPPNALFHLRLVAKNSFGVTATSAETTFTTLAAPPEIHSVWPAPRTDTTARLNGYLNPLNSATDFWFEYGPADCSANPCASVPPGQDASSGAGFTPVLVAQEIAGLQPGTTYHFCLRAQNSAGATSCEDHTFTTRSSEEVTLPENAFGETLRGIELVNNPDKGNQHAFIQAPTNGPAAITPDGERALWSVLGGAPGANTGAGAPFLARRTASGWRSVSLVPPPEEQLGEGFFGYGTQSATPDLSAFVVLTAKVVEGFFTGEGAVVRLGDEGQDEEILSVKPAGFEYSASSGLSADLTDDGAHVLLVEIVSEQLQDIGSGTPDVVSLLPPPGAPTAIGVPQPGGVPSDCRLNFSHSFYGPSHTGAGRNWRDGYHRIATTDASRAYFQVQPNGACAAPLALWVRNREDATTTLIDPGVAASDPELIRATPDGRSAYFVTSSQLDPADANSGRDIYRWDEGSGASTCLTCVVADAQVSGGDVMVSDDFSHLYFDSARQLAPEATPGQFNLYVLSGGEIGFVANPNDFEGSLRYRGAFKARLSQDGNVLTFKSARKLTADQLAPSAAQLYRYDDRDRSLECVSCLRGGETTHAVLTPTGGLTSGGDFELSGDGSTVAFVTAQALVPLDVNDSTDVYEWRAGVQRLITDGLSDFSQTGFAAPQVRDIDADGDNIFFSVVAPGLTGFEHDGLANVYDARIGGGFTPPSPPAHCTEDSCQGPLQPAPPQQGPGTATYSGSGNAKPQLKKKKRRCAKKRGKARRRCTRKHRRHSGRAKAQTDTRRAK